MLSKRVGAIQCLLLVGVAATLTGCAELRSALLNDTGPGEQTVAAGLREALRVGTQRAVGVTGKEDGFLANQLIRIPLPKQLDSLASGLRRIGFKKEVDSLEVAMNRAAERAAVEAEAVFVDAIVTMTLADAYGILKGGETAATDYFRGRTSDALRTRFRPIITAKMKDVGLYELYGRIIAKYESLPLVPKVDLDLDSYVTEKALDGLFAVLA